MEPVALGLTLIDLFVVAAVAVVLPAALGGRWRWWALAAAALAVACRADAGSTAAVLLVVPWLVVGSVVAVASIRSAGHPRSWTAADGTGVLACGYGLVAAGAMLVSRAGLTPLGFGEPIVQLTAVHFTYAAVGALALAVAARGAAAGRSPRRLGATAVGLTAGAPPVVAAGFVTGSALLQVGGAVLMSLGVFATGALELRRAASAGDPPVVRGLLALSGLAVWLPMVLAVAWAAGEHWDVPALSIPDMVRTHGSVNAVAFVGAGLLAVVLSPRDRGLRRGIPAPDGAAA